MAARMRRLMVVLLVLSLVAAACSGRSRSGESNGRTDYARLALNILPPGEGGAVPPGAHAEDQVPLYDGLTVLGDKVDAATLTDHFKSERFGVGDDPGTPESTPRSGLTVLRDSWGVPHITGATRADVEYGAGWVTAEDRGAFLEAIRGPARIAALDAPGLDAFSLATSLRTFTPSAATEALLSSQVAVLEGMGEPGRGVLADVDAYLEGLNAYYRSTGVSAAPWTRNDVLAASALIGAVFGKGGGDEVRRSQLLASLQAKLGSADGRAVFDDLRQTNVPAAPTTVTHRFPYEERPSGPVAGSAVVDPGSAQVVPPAPAPGTMSNALVLGATRSTTGHPIAVFGPQVGYYYPEFLMELDLHGGGIDARGAAFPGVSLYVLLGRGKDYAWSATSAGSDIIDQFVEELCNPDGTAATRASTSYRYKGECRPMTVFDAGMLSPAGGGQPQPVRYFETVHGPVSGSVTVDGKPYAVAKARSTRGREVASAVAFRDLNDNAVKAASGFARVMSQVDFTFNWFYVDDHDIAYFSSGRLPVRAPDTDPSLPTLGTGDYDWRGFLPAAAHPQVVNPPSGEILSWNNKPAPAFAAADDNWNYGSVQRVELFRGLHKDSRPEDVVAVMNRAATEDLRAAEVWPVVAKVLGASAPDPTTAKAADLVSAWATAGGSRLDRDLDGKVDDPGAAILDAAWPALATAVLSPVLGPLAGDGPGTLSAVVPRDNSANAGGSSYFAGWYGYVDTDLRTLLGEKVAARYSRPYCGNGDLAACRASLWQALADAAAGLAAAQGPDPAAWHADATKERIRFAPGLLATTMRWANRPTFQQVIDFDGHRVR